MNNLKDKVFVITGAGGTIAGEVETALREQGARVALVDKDRVRIQGRASTYNTVALECDFASLETSKQTIATIKEELGRVDGLIHLVGDVVTGSVAEASEADYTHAFDSNMKTLFNAVKATLPELLKQNEAFVAGIGAPTTSARGIPGSSLFVASKSAVAAFLRTLDAELSATKVNVSIVFPMDHVDTLANRKDFGSEASLISPKAIASAFVTAALSGDGGSLLELPVYPPRS